LLQKQFELPPATGASQDPGVAPLGLDRMSSTGEEKFVGGATLVLLAKTAKQTSNWPCMMLVRAAMTVVNANCT